MIRRLAIGLTFLVAAFTTYALFFHTSEEDRIRRQVAALADAVRIDVEDRELAARAPRVRKTFVRVLGPWVRVDIPDIVEDAHGREELAGMAISAQESFASLSVRFDPRAVELERGARAARVTGAATLTGTDRDGRAYREVRPVEMRFERIDGEWSMVALAVEAPER
jgi:hypothetical protein